MQFEKEMLLDHTKIFCTLRPDVNDTKKAKTRHYDYKN